MFETLKRLYLEKKATLRTLENAVLAGKITEAQKDEIIK